jgi:inosine/xanthosine triphosphatase
MSVSQVRVVVGSTNDVKVRATRAAFSNYYEAKVTGTSTASDVSDQPIGEEAFLGARNRARCALDSGEFDFGVGIEGGIISLYGLRFGFAAVCVISREGVISFSTSGMFPIPTEALKLVDSGKELGDAMDELTGLKETKRGPGAVGLLTKGVVDRTALYRDAVAFALIPHINPNYTWQPVQHKIDK